MNRLVHKQISDGIWAWVCPICSREFQHRTKPTCYRGSNLQSKGAASRHLMSHDPSLVKHGRNIMDCTYTKYDEELEKWVRKDFEDY